jgi:hypothetical protein
MFDTWFFEDVLDTIVIPSVGILLIIGMRYYSKSKK